MYQSSYFHKILYNITCQQCTCYAFQISAQAWNCLHFNQTCFFIHNYSSNDLGLKLIFNSSFLFTQFPPNSSPIISTQTTIYPFTSITTKTNDLSCLYLFISLFIFTNIILLLIQISNNSVLLFKVKVFVGIKHLHYSLVVMVDLVMRIMNLINHMEYSFILKHHLFSLLIQMEIEFKNGFHLQPMD